MLKTSSTIAAIATPPGQGGIGIIRISGSQVLSVAQAILKKSLQPRFTHYGPFFAADGSILDHGIALYFPAPDSFTGEDVLELQGHGGPIVLDLILKEIFKHAVVPAKPGEFSERAFLNGKLDLVQAEAIADLIAAQSEQAARSALRSLQGEFSAYIQQLVEALTQLRVYVEAAIDFPDEEVDFLSDERLTTNLQQLAQQLTEIHHRAQQGLVLQEGFQVVIAGLPNAGKSSLLNHLSGEDTAIVTDIPGTTRDVLNVYLQIDGLPLHITDTAGLRLTEDVIEQEGIRRAHQAIQRADCVLLLQDITQPQTDLHALLPPELNPTHQITVYNKIDLTGEAPAQEILNEQHTLIKLSAKTGEGLGLLRQQLKYYAGYRQTSETVFSARRRHLTALEQAQTHLNRAQDHLKNRIGELLAEELRLTQQALGEITGQVLPDELLGRIFSHFCIGK
ncbi:MAG: tRNA uridine-5-carboxymethylaminomethyl(34) synthesis GTPase MnmE [Gammaproteobacteria bacterium]